MELFTEDFSNFSALWNLKLIDSEFSSSNILRDLMKKI